LQLAANDESLPHLPQISIAKLELTTQLILVIILTAAKEAEFAYSCGKDHTRPAGRAPGSRNLGSTRDSPD
jgi:hypothetical protein